jgi:hypothetical protein
VRRIKEFIEEERESRKFYARLVVGTLLANLAGLAVAAFMWFVKIYPVIERLSRETALVVR